MQDRVRNKVTVNRTVKSSTRYYMYEFHLLLKELQTAAYSVEIWKSFRIWGGINVAIMQNVKDLVSSREVENIFENCDFVYMLTKSPEKGRYAQNGLIFYHISSLMLRATVSVMSYFFMTMLSCHLPINYRVIPNFTVLLSSWTEQNGVE